MDRTSVVLYAEESWWELGAPESLLASEECARRGFSTWSDEFWHQIFCVDG
jgi:hypothetical protein